MSSVSAVETRRGADVERPTILALFLGFSSIAVVGFGGVLPFARHALVDQRRWLSNEEFAETLGVAMLLPGGAIINVAVIVGAQFRGWLGSAAAVLGLVLGPMVVTLTLVALYQRFGTLELVRSVLGGLGPAAAGLLLGLAMTLARPLLRRRARSATPLIIGAFVMVGMLRIPLVLALLILFPVSALANRLDGR